ncbi:hypothetical protein DIPPA_34061 [Diplonema papillatum]|nr:hypothetical protein DIPPA_34061 [Diplonema papillatum]
MKDRGRDTAKPFGALDSEKLNGESDLLAYCVATLCAIDVILCVQIFHIRTVFGLVFSVCGLFGSASRRKSYVLMYVIHTSFTLVRGILHTSTIVLAHLNAISASDKSASHPDHASSVFSIFMLVGLECVELLIAVVVYKFYTSVRDDELARASLDEYAAPAAAVPDGEVASIAVASNSTDPNSAKPVTGGINSMLRRRGKRGRGK